MDRFDQLAGVLQAALIAGAAGKCVGQNRLLDTLLRASNLGVAPRTPNAPQESVPYGPRDRRQDAECVAGEQHDLLELVQHLGGDACIGMNCVWKDIRTNSGCMIVQ